MHDNGTAAAPDTARSSPALEIPVAFLPQSMSAGHRRQSARALAWRIARLRRKPFIELEQPVRRMRCYVVPCTTLVGAEPAGSLGIETEQDLFGGLVPHAVLAGKAIGHPLIDEDAARPAGWVPAFAVAVGNVVLRGLSAFDAASARRAGQQLLRDTPVRIKPGWADGGLGQAIADSPATLEAVLDALDPRAIADHGLVLEEDLREVCTFSVGRVRIGGTVLSYFGRQRTTKNNAGARVYGGSTLTVLRGPLENLRELRLGARMRRALDCAIGYDRAATEHLPGLVVSRRNYDIIHGQRPSGQTCIGVLEQSWRQGGASGAEIAAFEAMDADPELAAVRTACIEQYGPHAEPSINGFVYFHGDDPEAGLLTKHATVEARYRALPPRILT